MVLRISDQLPIFREHVDNDVQDQLPVVREHVDNGVQDQLPVVREHVDHSFHFSGSTTCWYGAC